MLKAKQYLYLAPLLFFLTASLPPQHLWAKEKIKFKVIKDQQKAESKYEKAPAQNQPQITIDSAHYNQGEVDEGDIIRHTFTVKNTGTAQLTIKDVKAG